MNRLLMLGSLLLFAASVNAANARDTLQGPPVEFAVAKNDTSLFYVTRELRKGDRFEVRAHNLHQTNNLIVVPCHPSCENPNFAYAYQLQPGIQHFRIPSTGEYYFWVERDQIGGNGIPYRYGFTRLPLAVTSAQSTENNFVAQFDGDTEMSIRALYTRPLEDPAS